MMPEEIQPTETKYFNNDQIYLDQQLSNDETLNQLIIRMTTNGESITIDTEFIPADRAQSLDRKLNGNDSGCPHCHYSK